MEYSTGVENIPTPNHSAAALHTVLQQTRLLLFCLAQPAGTQLRLVKAPPLTPPRLARTYISWNKKACHRRRETLNISEFTSSQASGSGRSDGPPKRSPIKDKDTGKERQKKRGRRREGGKGGGRNPAPLSDSGWDVLRWYEHLHTVCALRWEAVCPGSQWEGIAHHIAMGGGEEVLPGSVSYFPCTAMIKAFPYVM